MRFVGFKILREIVRQREISYREAAELLPIKFGDHRDFYPLASLYVSGFIGATVYQQPKPDDPDPAMFMASFFYAVTRGPGKHKVNNFTAMNEPDSDLKNHVFATAKADLYFAERRQFWVNHLVTVATSIAVAVASTLLTLWLTGLIFPGSR